MKPCPACNQPNEESALECSYCGIIFSKWIARNQRPAANTNPSHTSSSLASPTASTIESAGFWVRSGAFFIDGALIILLSRPLMSIGTSRSLLTRLLPLLFTYAYYTWTVGTWGQTLGKRCAGIKVICTDGSTVSYPRAFLRELAKTLSTIFLGIGYWMVPFTKMKQALHDQLVSTRVIFLAETSKERKTVMTIIGVFPFIFLLFIFLWISSLRGNYTRTQTSTNSTMLSRSSSSSIPKSQNMNSLMDNAVEARNKGSLGMLRSTISIYYGENLKYPKTLAEMPLKSQGSQIPMLNLSNHAQTSDVEIYEDDICPGQIGFDGSKLRDSGKWGYVSNPTSKCNGMAFIDCTHIDNQGKHWYQW